MQLHVNIHERTVQSLVDVIGTLGGIFELFEISLMVVVGYVASKMFEFSVFKKYVLKELKDLQEQRQKAQQSEDSEDKSEQEEEKIVSNKNIFEKAFERQRQTAYFSQFSIGRKKLGISEESRVKTIDKRNPFATKSTIEKVSEFTYSL